MDWLGNLSLQSSHLEQLITYNTAEWGRTTPF